MPALNQTLQSLNLGQAVTVQNLTVVPLLARDALAPDYLLLDDALDAGLAEVSEVSDGGSVPELSFLNRSDRDILLVDGEELVGAKQNRVLNLSLLVAAGQRVVIPVSCVEAGRWAWRSSHFEAGKRRLHASARSEKMRGVSASMREHGSRASHDVQAAVWRSVADKMSSYEAESDTRSLHDVYASAEDRLAGLRHAFPAQPGQVGAAFFVGGQFVGLELYDAPATLAKQLPKLIDSVSFDALESASGNEVPAAPDLAQVRALLARIAAAPAAAYPSVATGQDLRIDAQDLHAAALVARDRVVHLAAFVA
jgi:hypothetical protein